MTVKIPKNISVITSEEIKKVNWLERKIDSVFKFKEEQKEAPIYFNNGKTIRGYEIDIMVSPHNTEDAEDIIDYDDLINVRIIEELRNRYKKAGWENLLTTVKTNLDKSYRYVYLVVKLVLP